MSANYKYPYAYIAVLLTAFMSACSDQNNAKSAKSGAATDAVSVDVAPVISLRITEWDGFTGRLESPKTVSLRPRVSGYIKSVTFEEGADVHRGDTLFLIDDRQFKAEVERLSAQLKEAQSRLKLAKSDLARASTLYKSHAISKELFDTRDSEVEQARALVAQTRAALKSAELNLGFARVKAPIAGRVSRAYVTEGNFVSAGQSVMTSLVSTEQLYAYFDIDETTWLNYQKQQLPQETARPVVMRLANEADYAHWGRLDFVDNQLNPQTGTLRVRAVFDNTKRKLLPGLFAHLKLASSPPQQGVLVAEKAIGTDLDNKYVLLVDNENTVQYRSITLGDKVGSLRIIKSGLRENDKIVVNGLQRVTPGSRVTPELVNMADAQIMRQLQVWQKRSEDIYSAVKDTPLSVAVEM